MQRGPGAPLPSGPFACRLAPPSYSGADRCAGHGAMSGYENSSWREVASIVLVIVIVIITIAGAIWALRRLLVAWGLV
jgi:hypothetical protein